MTRPVVSLRSPLLSVRVGGPRVGPVRSDTEQHVSRRVPPEPSGLDRTPTRQGRCLSVLFDVPLPTWTWKFSSVHKGSVPADRPVESISPVGSVSVPPRPLGTAQSPRGSSQLYVKSHYPGDCTSNVSGSRTLRKRRSRIRPPSAYGRSQVSSRF